MTRFTTVLSAVLCLAPAAPAQDIQVAGDEYVLQFDEVNGEKLEDFIDLAKNILQRPIRYDPTMLADTRIRIVGPQTVKRDMFFQYFQAVLKAYDFIVVNYGPEGSSFLSIQRITAGGGTGRAVTAKAQAPIVPVERLVEYSQDPATLITTTIPLKYVESRNVMSTFQGLVDATIESVRNVDNSNALVIQGFGQHVWGIYQLAQLIDVPPFKPQPVIHKRELKWASVDELSGVLDSLLAASRGQRPGQPGRATPAGGGLSSRQIEPHIIGEARSNSLLIAGDEETVARIETWIDLLDVEVDPRGDTHVYRLKNTNAQAIADLLGTMLEQDRTQRTQARAQAGSGGTAGTGIGLEAPASVVADPDSNSLLITASDRVYAEMVEIIRELDIRRRQVLIEAAIVETSRTLNDTFKAGVALGDLGVGAFLSNFGTPTGIQEDGTIDINNALSVTGGQAAVFSGADLPIPLLLQVLQSDASNRVLSRPSLLTNDNEEASIATQTETSFQTSTIAQGGQQSFTFDQVEAGISLSVSPTISAGNYLRLHVQIEVSDFAPPSSTAPNAPPDITRREIDTQVTLADAHTVVLGGLVSQTSSDTDKWVPWLADLPLVGWMFRSDVGITTDRYLYLFITPHIIDTDFARLYELTDLGLRDYERLGGDISDLSSVPLPRTPDGPMFDSVFEMPAPAFPVYGDRSGGGAPPPREERAPSGDAPPPKQPETPTFDDVFGADPGS